MRKVKCKSGITGWQSKLQKIYSSFEEFKAYCEGYNIHERLGFNSIETCWNTNPLIRGSVNPSDLEVIRK